MASIKRVCFLKHPPQQITSNQPIEFSVTISTDLGVYCGVDVDYLVFEVQLIKVRPDPILSSTTAKSNKRLTDTLHLKVLEPKSFIQKDNVTYWFKLKANREYLEFNFSLQLETKDQIIEANSQVQLFIAVGSPESGPELPGGRLCYGHYFLSLYSNPIIIKSNLQNYNDLKTGLLSMSDKENTGSRRYFNFIQEFIPKSLVGDYMAVLEKPFGKDLASHSWDCAWLGLDYLTELLFSPETNYSPKMLEFRNLLVSLNPSEAIIELGSGCGLLSLGLAKLLVHFHKQNIKKVASVNLILSDLEAVLVSCERNMFSNMKLTPKPKDSLGVPFKKTGTLIDVSLIPLDWEQPLSQKTFPSPRIILAFDVVYNDTAHVPLTTILKELTNRVSKHNESTYILLGYKPRSNAVERGFFIMIREDFNLHRVITRFGLHLLLLTPRLVN